LTFAPVLTVAVVLHVPATSDHLPRSCVTTTPLRKQHVTAVLRTGPLIDSVTLRADGDVRLYACDRTGVAFERRRWCATAAGILRVRRVTDPRLQLFCRTRGGRRVATAWVNPSPRANRVVVDNIAYPVAGRLPIRIASTHGIDYARARARFDVRELDSRGRLVTRHRLLAQVSG
jgi:hypothetical protein